MSGESCFLPRRQDKVRDSGRGPSSSLKQKSVSKSRVKIVPYPPESLSCFGFLYFLHSTCHIHHPFIDFHLTPHLKAGATGTETVDHSCVSSTRKSVWHIEDV